MYLVPGGVPGQRWVYLVPGGVPGPGDAPGLGGVPDAGVYLVGGGTCPGTPLL